MVYEDEDEDEDDGIAQIAGPQVIDYTASKCLATTLITDAFLRRLID